MFPWCECKPTEAPGGRPEELQERFGRDRADGSRRRRHVAVERFVDDDKQSTRASQLATYNSVKETILERGLMRDGLGTHVTSSFAVGFVASVTSNPVDIKTRVMNMKVEAGKTAPYKGAVDCMLKTVRAEGIMALYKGFLPTVSRQAPFTMIMPVVLIYFNQSSTMSSSAATVAQQSVSSSTFDDLSLGPTSQVVAGQILCFWD
ncbi:unnamed protein product [Brassica rapa subsp. trilocularis]